MVEHRASGFVNLAASLTGPGSNVIQVKLLSFLFSNFDYLWPRGL